MYRLTWYTNLNAYIFYLCQFNTIKCEMNWNRLVMYFLGLLYFHSHFSLIRSFDIMIYRTVNRLDFGRYDICFCWSLMSTVQFIQVHKWTSAHNNKGAKKRFSQQCSKNPFCFPNNLQSNQSKAKKITFCFHVSERCFRSRQPLPWAVFHSCDFTCDEINLILIYSTVSDIIIHKWVLIHEGLVESLDRRSHPKLQQVDFLTTCGSLSISAPTVNPCQSSRVVILPFWKRLYMPLVRVSNASLTLRFSFVDTSRYAIMLSCLARASPSLFLTCRPTARSLLWPTSKKNMGLGFT